DAQAVLPQETGELLDPGIHRMRKVARSATVRRMLIALLVCSPLLVQAKPGLTAIAPGTIAAHVRFLADDLLEGRGTGERGHAVAERYVVSQMQILGLRPAGEAGNLLEEVLLRDVEIDPEPARFGLAGKA